MKIVHFELLQVSIRLYKYSIPECDCLLVIIVYKYECANVVMINDNKINLLLGYQETTASLGEE